MAKQTHHCSEKDTIDGLKMSNATMTEKIINIEKKLDSVDSKIDKLPQQLAHVFVSKVEYESTLIDVNYLKKIVFGTIGIILVAVLMAFIYLVINKPVL